MKKVFTSVLRHGAAHRAKAAQARKKARTAGGRVTLDRLKEVLYYSPETGKFVWLKELRSGSKPGTEAGNVRKESKPYIRITIDGRAYYAHVLARFYVTGEWPAQLVDHRDGDGLNNRFDNLRDADHLQNAHNKQAKSADKLPASGATGVTKLPGGSFQSRIMANGKRIKIGCFETLEEAKAAYEEARRQHHWQVEGKT